MNLGLLLDMAASGFGDRIAVGTKDDGLTFAQVAALAGRLAADLRTTGTSEAARKQDDRRVGHSGATTNATGDGVLSPASGSVTAGVVGGDAPQSANAVAVAAPTGLHTPVVLFGAAAAGFTYAPLNHRLPGESLGELVRRLHPGTLLCTPQLGDELAAILPSGAGDQPDGAAARRLARSAPADGGRDAGSSAGAGGLVPVDVAGWLAALRERQAGEPAPFSPIDEPEAPAVLLYTSGTSSAPKAAVLHHDHLLTYIFNSLEFGSAGPDDATLVAAPPFHVAGVAAVLSSCYTGRRLVPLPRFTAEAWLDLAARERVTHAFVVPTMLARIVAAMEADGSRRVPSLKLLTYGGARMPLPVLERALELFPEIGFVNAYGLTETSSTVSILGPDDHREAAASSSPAARRRLESAGRPLPGIDVRIAGPDGSPVTTGAAGEIWVRGDQVSGSYLDVGTRVDADGWLHTGDQGWVDGDGYLFVTGRLDDMIITGGENIAPAEVEDALLRHPDVAAAAVVGVADAEWGERVGAVVVPRDAAELDPATLTDWVRERLGTLKTPARLQLRAELPTTDTGKVLKRTLRADLESQP